MTSRANLFCRTATTFTPDGRFDAASFPDFLQRFVENGIGVYLGSAGSGESGSMTLAELTRLYEIGVDTCKDSIPVHANPPEKPSVRETIEHMQLAIRAGVEIVNLYGPASSHGYKPTDAELRAFYREVLTAIRHPIALSPNPSIGHAPSAQSVAELCHEHHQIVAINLIDQGDDYFIELQDRLRRHVDLNVQITGSMELLLLGASAVVGAESNMIPRTYRKYMDLVQAGDLLAAARQYADIKRFNRYVAAWRGAHPRWIKMMMKVMGMPGHGLREPYVMPAEAELASFKAGLLGLGLPEINELAGSAVPDAATRRR